MAVPFNVDVTTGYTLVIAANLVDRQSVAIYNNDSSTTIWLGESTAVTKNNGYPLFAGAERLLDTTRYEFRSPIYAVSDAGTVDVRVWEHTK